MTLRIASAAVGVPVLAIFVWLGLPAFSVLIAVLAAIGTWEVCRMAEERGHSPDIPVAVTWSVALVVTGHVLADDLPSRDIGRALAVILATAVLFWQVRRSRVAIGLAGWRITAAAALYPGGMLAFAPLLRGLDQGREWVFFLVLVTFATDTAAFAVGKLIGRTPLAPSISPGKTREGAIAGLVAAGLSAVALSAIFNLDASVPTALGLGLVLGVAGQAGDLSESRLKRWAGVKDSGTLVPGHGGVLDRLDSVVFNLALVYYFVLWVVQ
jgi:phosphatidate cytidylyltransferase